jgi:hypothetical protein
MIDISWGDHHLSDRGPDAKVAAELLLWNGS